MTSNQLRPFEDSLHAIAESIAWHLVKEPRNVKEMTEYMKPGIRQLLSAYSEDVDHLAKQNLEWAECAEKWRQRAETAESRLAEAEKALRNDALIIGATEAVLNMGDSKDGVHLPPNAVEIIVKAMNKAIK